MFKILGHFRPSHGSTTSTNPTLPNATTRSSINDPNLPGHAPMDTNRGKEKRLRRDLEAAEDQFQGWVDPYGPAPTIKQWFKLYWHDILAFVFMAVVSVWLLMWSPVPYRKLFAVTYSPQSGTTPGSQVVNPGFAHPKQSQIMPIVVDALLAVFVPWISIWFTNLFGISTHGPNGRGLRMKGKRGGFFLGRGSFWNVNNGCWGVIYSVMTGATLQIIIKLVIGGLRPHFLVVCDPQIDGVKGQGFQGLYFDITVCRDYENRKALIANAMQSFPSGHSIAAWAGFFYLSLYLNAHMKIFANYQSSLWKLLLFLAPILAATLIVGSLTLDMSHNWYDIVVGSVMGVVTAILSYRMCFASVWDFRCNHIPLPRNREIPGFGYGIQEFEDWSGCVATRKGGWGVATKYSQQGRLWGAPGDCSGFSVSSPIGGDLEEGIRHHLQQPNVQPTYTAGSSSRRHE